MMGQNTDKQSGQHQQSYQRHNSQNEKGQENELERLKQQHTDDNNPDTKEFEHPSKMNK